MSEAGRRVALVTGASSGIGLATAEALGRAGYRVAAWYGRHREPAEAVARRTGGLADGLDVADPTAVARAVARVEDELGPVEIAVSNAGHYEERPLEAIDDAAWERMLRVHLGGAYHLARALAPRMGARGRGSIVTVASELVYLGGVEVAHYVAAKAALLGLTRSLARELAPAVRVNAVAPGAVDTPLLPDRDRGPAYLATVPLGRIGRPEEIAEVIVALARTEWTTGAVWWVNGGVVIQ